MFCCVHIVLLNERFGSNTKIRKLTQWSILCIYSRLVLFVAHNTIHRKRCFGGNQRPAQVFVTCIWPHWQPSRNTLVPGRTENQAQTNPPEIQFQALTKQWNWNVKILPYVGMYWSKCWALMHLLRLWLGYVKPSLLCLFTLLLISQSGLRFESIFFFKELRNVWSKSLE